MCPADDLAPGDSLLDDDEVARYCRPSDYDRQANTPVVTAFMRREKEPDLSVNRLQFFSDCAREEAVDCIRREFCAPENYECRPNGRFVVFNVAQAKAAVKEKGFDIGVEYTPKPAESPKPAQPSHCSIFGLPTDKQQETRAATALMRLIGQPDTYVAVM